MIYVYLLVCALAPKQMGQSMINDLKALKRAAGYANKREVFGLPIGQNRGIRYPLAKSWMQFEAAYLMAKKVAWLHNQHFPCTAEANNAKYLATEAYYHACENAISTHGGVGHAK